MLTAAVVPVLTLPIETEFAGPAGPAGPCGSTKDKLCDGATPLMLTAAVAPVLTLSIESEFAGPGWSTKDKL
jgi:hypothetical protein